MSLTKVSYSMISGSPFNVLDFGADATGVNDSTSAFLAAQQNGKVEVVVPPGTYKLNNLTILDGVKLIGYGKSAVTIIQANSSSPAINCTSDVSVGQLKNIELSGFTVLGATGATVAAVLVAAYGPYAIWNSTFDYSAEATYRALEIQGADANNIFQCKFVVQSQNTTGTAVLINGGVYNLFDLFLTQCKSYALTDAASYNCTFLRFVTDGAWTSSSQTSVFLNPTVEDIYANTSPSQTLITLTGFNQTLINLTVILNGTASAKITNVVQTFVSTMIIEPRFLCTATNPFLSAGNYYWTLVGPGESQCINKMESVYTGSASHDLRQVTFVGNCSAFTSNSVPHGGKATQYSAPSGPINITIKNNTDCMIFEPTGTISFINVNLGDVGNVPLNGQVLTVSSTQAITTINVADGTGSGIDVSLVPNTIAANSSWSIIYNAANTKWYLA